MAINVRVTKAKKESDSSVLRRFSREMRSNGVVKAKKAKRFFSRQPSKNTRKAEALERIKRTAEYEKLRKLGKIG